MYIFKLRKWFIINNDEVYTKTAVSKPLGDVVINITDVDFLVKNKETGSFTTYRNTCDGKDIILYEDGVKRWKTGWDVESLCFDNFWEVLWCSFDNSFLKSFEKTLKIKPQQKQHKNRWFEFWK